MRHRGLDVVKIRNLVNSSEGLPDRAGSAFAAFCAAKRAVSHRFKEGKKLLDGDLKQVAATFDEAIQKLKPFACRHDYRPATRAHPKGERYESCYSLVLQPDRIHGFDDIYQICSVRMYATRKNVRVDFLTHPAAFQYHAAERLSERSVSIDDPLDSLARSLTRWLPYIYEAESRRKINDICCVPVDETGGMMIGEFTGKLRICVERYDFGRSAHGVDVMPPFFDLNRTFVARTFVGESQLRPAQSHAMQMLSDWYAAFDADCKAESERYLWPWSMDDDHASQERGFNSPAQSLHQILGSHEFVNATPPAPMRSSPVTTFHTSNGCRC